MFCPWLRVPWGRGVCPCDDERYDVFLDEDLDGLCSTRPSVSLSPSLSPTLAQTDDDLDDDDEEQEDTLGLRGRLLPPIMPPSLRSNTSRILSKPALLLDVRSGCRRWGAVVLLPDVAALAAVDRCFLVCW